MRNLPRLVPLAAALAAAFACNAETLPQGETLRDGQATVVRTSASRLDILQASNRAVLDWQSFSIGAGGHVNFQQPSASSLILNRVVGIDPSLILGRLTANGMVFLVNPNGIVFGQSARIDVGSLVASTANISTENFMAGRYLFDDVINRHATIVNDGLISAADGGLIALIAPGVANSGTLRANLGRVVLASGNAFTLDLFGDQLIAFAVDDKVTERLTDLEGRALRAYVEHSGTIEAQSVLITANAARAVLDNVINMSGVVRATGASQRGGEVVLYGEDVTVTRSAVIDVSGGSGGRVTINSENHTQFDGYVNAKSADAFVEISGKKTLGYEGSVDMSAGGRLLFDPTELDIGAAMAATLSGTMRSGATATASTTTGDLAVSAMIDGRGGVAGGGLTLTAGGAGAILVNADILTNAGAVNMMTAGGAIAMGTTGSVLPGSTLIHTGAGGSINLNAGGGMLTAGRLVSGGGVTLTGSSIIVDRTINAGGAVTFNAGVGGTEFRHSVFTTSGNITLNGLGIINPAGDELGFNTDPGGSVNSEIQTSAAQLNASSMAPSRTVSTAPVLAWDAITAKITLRTENGNITVNGGLVHGAEAGRTAVNSLKWYRGDVYDTGFAPLPSRASLTPAPIRWFGVNLVAGSGGTVSLKGTIGYASAVKPNDPAGNPGHPAVGNLLPTPDNTFQMLAAGGVFVDGGGVTGFVNALRFNDVNTSLGTIAVGAPNSNHPSGGQLIPPSPTSANVGSGATYLGEINLPSAPVIGTSPVDVAAATLSTTVTTNLLVNPEQQQEGESIETGGRGAAASADLGRAGASSGAAADVFGEGFYLVDGRAAGPNADQAYFTDTPFQAAERRRRSR